MEVCLEAGDGPRFVSAILTLPAFGGGGREAPGTQIANAPVSEAIRSLLKVYKLFSLPRASGWSAAWFMVLTTKKSPKHTTFLRLFSICEPKSVCRVPQINLFFVINFGPSAILHLIMYAHCCCLEKILPLSLYMVFEH